jgi:hypothetical protein
MTNIVLSGSNQNYSRSGNVITNTGTFADIHNVPSDASDLENLGSIKVSRQAITSPSSTGSVTYQVPQLVDSVNIQGIATIANLTLTFPLPPAAPGAGYLSGQDIRFIFDVAVTTLAFTAPTGYTVETAGTPTSATAGSHYSFELVGTVWKIS